MNIIINGKHPKIIKYNLRKTYHNIQEFEKKDRQRNTIKMDPKMTK